MSVTANQNVTRGDCERLSGPIAASTRLYKDTLVFVSATGYLDDDTASGANSFAGVSVDDYDNSSGSAGDISGEVRSEGRFLLTGSGFTQASVGDDVFASDNFTITTVSTASTVRIGKITDYVSSTQVWVEIETLNKLLGKLGGGVAGATITVGAENANVRAITIQLTDANGNDIAQREHVFVGVFLDANPDAFVVTGGSTGIAIGTDGALLALVAKKFFSVVSEADGDIDLTWTDTGTEAAYLGVILPNGKIVMSTALTNT
jgi:hypothetical protein